jgi:hypothetical protein
MKIITIVLLIFNSIDITCYSQKITDDIIIVKEGVLIYYMNEPYFFQVKDTSFEKISKSNAVGLKLGKIDRNDILDSVSHKKNIVIYAAGDNNKIDTFKSRAGVLPVRLVTKPVKTKLSSDTSAFALVSGINEWVFRYEFQFDKEIVSVEPLIASDVKEYKRRLRKLRLQN